jgi:hypothetical protein
VTGGRTPATLWVVSAARTFGIAGLLIALGGCGGSVPAGAPDMSAPVLHIEFMDLPAQGDETAPPTDPQSYLGSMPSQVDTVLGETYQVIATLSDEESGVEYFEIEVSYAKATCQSSPTGAPLPDRLPSVEGPLSRISGTRPPQYLSPPTPGSYPTQRVLTAAVVMGWRGGCPSGTSLMAEARVSVGGRNGAGLRVPATGFGASGWYDGQTHFFCRYPDRPRR